MGKGGRVGFRKKSFWLKRNVAISRNRQENQKKSVIIREICGTRRFVSQRQPSVLILLPFILYPNAWKDQLFHYLLFLQD